MLVRKRTFYINHNSLSCSNVVVNTISQHEIHRSIAGQEVACSKRIMVSIANDAVASDSAIIEGWTGHCVDICTSKLNMERFACMTASQLPMMTCICKRTVTLLFSSLVSHPHGISDAHSTSIENAIYLQPLFDAFGCPLVVP